MGSHTSNLNLYKANPATDGNDTFNIDTMLNDNWDKLDEFAKEQESKVQPIDKGGTDAKTAAEALANLGALSNYLGIVPDADLLAWADKQTVGGSFRIYPGITTSGYPCVGAFAYGFLQIYAGEKTIILIRSFQEGVGYFKDMYFISTGNGIWQEWTQVADASKFLPLAGGEVNGSLSVVGTLSVSSNAFFANGTILDSSGKSKAVGDNKQVLMASVGPSDNPNCEGTRNIGVKNKLNNTAIADAVFFRNFTEDDVYVEYRLFGEYNKPSGSYTGNGSSTSRTIDTGGVGNAILIWTNSSMYIACPTGCFFFAKDTYKDNMQTDAVFSNGVLTITSSSAFANSNGVTYNYQVL